MYDLLVVDNITGEKVYLKFSVAETSFGNALFVELCKKDDDGVGVEHDHTIVFSENKEAVKDLTGVAGELQ